MDIKFSHKYSKLCRGRDFCESLLLLDVINVRLEDLSPTFLEYDTDDGLFELPKKGDYMMLILQKDNTTSGTNLMTTLRRRTPEKEKYYREAIGKWFNVVIK